jgi:ribbon-helix-helix protein
MRQNKLGKITTSVTFEINQLERLNDIAHRTRVSRSTIVRDAIERELERYERAHPPRKVDPVSPEKGSGTASTADVRRP